MVAVHTQQATKAISARSDVGGPFIDLYTVYVPYITKTTWVAVYLFGILNSILSDSNCSALPLLLDPRPLISVAWTRG